jgi:hypothetical protein
MIHGYKLQHSIKMFFKSYYSKKQVHYVFPVRSTQVQLHVIS